MRLQLYPPPEPDFMRMLSVVCFVQSIEGFFPAIEKLMQLPVLHLNFVY